MLELSRGTKWLVPVAVAVLAGDLALSGCQPACTEAPWEGDLRHYGARVPISLIEAASLVNDQDPGYAIKWAAIKATVTGLLKQEAPPAGMTFQVSVGTHISQYPDLAAKTEGTLPAIASYKLDYPVGGSPDAAVEDDSIMIFVEPIAPPPTCESQPSSMGADVGARSLQGVGLSPPY